MSSRSTRAMYGWSVSSTPGVGGQHIRECFSSAGSLDSTNVPLRPMLDLDSSRSLTWRVVYARVDAVVSRLVLTRWVWIYHSQLSAWHTWGTRARIRRATAEDVLGK